MLAYQFELPIPRLVSRPASNIELGFPHVFLGRGMVRGFVYGGTRDLIDNHRE